MKYTALQNHSQLFSCPHCKKNLTLTGNSLLCENKHCFDLARSGYVNMLTKPVKTEYDKEMLSSRKITIDSGFFHPLLDEILTLFPKEISSGYLLDAGCGEGSHLAYLQKKLPQTYQGIGLDISKEGILLASKNDPQEIWLVGDLANMPFQDHQISILLNLLSPANYTEFLRILKPTGKLIKVVPSKHYLQELREIFYENTEQEEYSNAQVVSLFQEIFPDGKQHHITYEFPVTPELLPHIIRMSPLSWNTTPDKIEQALAKDISHITLDFTILTNK